jgi:hypothetical protein
LPLRKEEKLVFLRGASGRDVCTLGKVSLQKMHMNTLQQEIISSTLFSTYFTTKTGKTDIKGLFSGI